MGRTTRLIILFFPYGFLDMAQPMNPNDFSNNFRYSEAAKNIKVGVNDILA